jgi:lipopolysaccharide/colanic/teichoic acid biosynthesis glycosyltransferase
MNPTVTEELKAAGSIIIERAIQVPQNPQVGVGAVSKRALDILIACTALILLSPLLLFVSIAILIETGRPVMFAQRRMGQGGKFFTVYKFRSMTQDAECKLHEVRANNQIKDGPIFKWKTDPRITRVGRFLRRTSLDEAPQLFNVLLGSMSRVGPRPPLESEVLQYEDWQLRRLAVRPGMTGLWQVSGRSDLSFTQMVQLDIEYVNRWTPWLDIQLLLRTPVAVITGRGAY